MEQDKAQPADQKENHPHLFPHIPAAEILQREIEKPREEIAGLVMLGKHLAPGQRAMAPRLELAPGGMPFVPIRDWNPVGRNPMPHQNDGSDRNQRQQRERDRVPRGGEQARRQFHAMIALRFAARSQAETSRSRYARPGQAEAHNVRVHA